MAQPARPARPRRILHLTVVAVVSALAMLGVVSTQGAGAADTNPPIVSVTSPSDGDVVSGMTTLSATAPGADLVTWYVDGAAVATDTNKSWSRRWDSSTVGNGTHSLEATGIDSAGNVGTSATVSFTVRNSATTSPPPPSPSAASPCGTTDTPPAAWNHVVWIVMENKPFDAIIGSSNAPYINELAGECGLATNYHAVTHPSLPNYIAMTSGSTHSISDDRYPVAHPLSGPSIFSQMGSDWQALQESMTSNCLLVNAGDYAVKHNPAAYYTGIATECATQDVPLSGTPDVSAAFTFLTPNLCHDMHDCSVATGDTWLKTQLPKILNSTEYAAGRTAVFLTWDEDDSSASNHIPTLVISPSTPPGTTSSTSFTHYSLLRTAEEIFGRSLLNNAANASSMRAAFNL